MTEQARELVALHLSGSVKIPQEIYLPMKLVAALGVSRRYMINDREQRVPRAIKDWLKQHPRHAGIFASEDEDAGAQAEVMPKKSAERRKTAKVQLPPQEAVQKPPADESKQEAAQNAARSEEDAESDDEATNDDQGASGDEEQKVTKLAEPYPNAAWSLQWNVVDLRAYAKDHEVALTSSDRRDDVIGKLVDAKLPQQVVDTPEDEPQANETE